MYSKLVRVNFIVILCDGTTDVSVTEQEVACFFVDPDSMEPTLEFFECLERNSSRDATGVFDAMIAAFQKHDLSPSFQNIIILYSDGASVKSGLTSGLISVLQED